MIEEKVLFRKYAPKTIDEYVCSDDLKMLITNIVEGKKDYPGLIFSGIQGTGKTSLCLMLADILNADYKYINASKERGIDVIRTKINDYCTSGKSLTKSYPYKIVILDEMEKLTIDAQDSLKADIEIFSNDVKFLCTTNNHFKINPAIRDRLELVKVGVDNSNEAKKKFLKRLIHIMKSEGIEYTGDMKNIAKVLLKSFPSFRTPINLIQVESVKNEVIDFDKLSAKKEEEVNDIFKEMLNLLDRRDSIGIHSFVYEKAKLIDRDEFYGFLSKNLEKITKGDHARMILIGESLGDRYFQSFNVMVIEINYISALYNILYILEEGE